MSLLLLMVLCFQVSFLSEILDIKLLSRSANAAILVLVSLLTSITVMKRKPSRIVLLYVLPILILLAGYSVNLLRSVDLKSMGMTSILLPWVAALSIPFLSVHDAGRSWRIFYYFMFITITLSLIEYYAIFGGLLATTVLETDHGVFLRGVISILHRLDSGSPHYRFYGVMAEPGSTAMLVLPALVYSVLFSKKIGILVFMLALFLTDSLGGYIGLGPIIVSFLLWKMNAVRYSLGVRAVVGLIVLLCACLVIAYCVGQYFIDRYEAKGDSALTREQNAVGFVGNIGDLFRKHPLGVELDLESFDAFRHNSPDSYGTNLMFNLAFMYGGVLGFVGYSLFYLNVIVCTVRYHLSNYVPDRIYGCVFVSLPSLLLFAVQRDTVLESMLFAFLFAPPLIEIMGERPTYVVQGMRRKRV